MQDFESTETQERDASMPDRPSTLDAQDADFELNEDDEQDETGRRDRR